MIQAKEIFTPSTDSAGTSDTFDVDKHSRVIYLAPDSGETLTDDDAFELRRVVAEDPIRSIKQLDKDGAILLGANLPQFEVVIRGTYLIEKLLGTTEAVGVYETFGFERGV